MCASTHSLLRLKPLNTVFIACFQNHCLNARLVVLLSGGLRPPLEKHQAQSELFTNRSCVISIFSSIIISYVWGVVSFLSFLGSSPKCNWATRCSASPLSGFGGHQSWLCCCWSLQPLQNCISCLTSYRQIMFLCEVLFRPEWKASKVQEPTALTELKPLSRKFVGDIKQDSKILLLCCWEASASSGIHRIYSMCCPSITLWSQIIHRWN